MDKNHFFAENSNDMKRTVLLVLMFLGTLILLNAEVVFSDLDLSESDTLLFQAESTRPGEESYRTLFVTDIGKNRMEQLTFFPERITYLSEQNQLQIQNRFGVFRTDNTLTRMGPVGRFPAFVNGKEVEIGQIIPAGASPDGAYILYLLPSSASYGDLVLFDAATQREETIAQGVEISFEGPNAKWSPRSDFFVYTKEKELFYYSVDQFENNRVMAEEYRKIGDGNIHSVRWDNENSTLFYVHGSLVYKIMSAEFFTGAIYSEIVKPGTIIGKIPFDFNIVFDRFWISPNGSTMLLNKGGRNLFLYYLTDHDYAETAEIVELPYMYLPRSERVRRVLWTEADMVTILTGGIDGGGEKTSLFHLDLTAKQPVFSKAQIEGARDITLSPNHEKIALLMEDRLEIRGSLSFSLIQSVSLASPLQMVWKDEEEVFIAGENFTVLRNLQTGKEQIVCFSQPNGHGFDEDTRNILVKVGYRTFELDRTEQSWREKNSFTAGSARNFSKSYRVYLENSNRGSYQNMVMVRKIKGYGTDPLFSPPAIGYESFPDKDDPVDFSNFSHGSRIRRREVAIVFNAIDGVEGLTETLNTLKAYGIKATFFINGEFIQRHPDAVKQIAETGHEVGSLFSSYFNLTDAKYSVDETFIKKGLARNEDAYFNTTGKEVSLLWHTPYYVVSSEILKAAETMNYIHISRDIDSLDWVTKEYAQRLSGIYMPAADLVERILEKKKPGSIIPIRLGKSEGSRDDYLFQKLDLLFDGLLSLGYEVVPVSTLIDHAR